MEARQEAPQILPLRYSSHRQIVAANGGLACQVFSGSIGIKGADQLQELIVRACNSHDDLVAALQDFRDLRDRLDGVSDAESRGRIQADVSARADAALAKATGAA